MLLQKIRSFFNTTGWPALIIAFSVGMGFVGISLAMTGKWMSAFPYFTAAAALALVKIEMSISKQAAEAPRPIKFSPGDVVDKIVILGIKVEKLTEGDPRSHKIVTELAYGLDFLEDMLIYKPVNAEALARLADELCDINRAQWNMEDRVRSEKSWEAAQAARENNNLRVAKKNEINRLFGWMEEVKEYKAAK